MENVRIGIDAPRSATGAIRRYGSIVAILAGLASLVCWAYALWENYVRRPVLLGLVLEFELAPDPISDALLRHAGWLLPILALASVVAAIVIRRRIVWAVPLFVLPASVAVALTVLEIWCVLAVTRFL